MLARRQVGLAAEEEGRAASFDLPRLFEQLVLHIFHAALKRNAIVDIANNQASMVQCQPTKLSWAQGSAPFFVSIIPGGQAGAAPLKDFGKQDGNELTYTVDLPAGAM